MLESLTYTDHDLLMSIRGYNIVYSNVNFKFYRHSHRQNKDFRSMESLVTVKLSADIKYVIIPLSVLSEYILLNLCHSIN